MIGYLSGEVFEVFENNIILLVNGVGYRVFPTNRFLEKSKKGKQASLYITSVIKEDTFDLYGFENVEEKKLFELIINVSGIGPKTGLGILSKGKKDDIMKAISNNDITFFSGVPRLGKKNAQKLIIELKNKTGDIGSLTFVESKEREELMQALKGFGYQEKEIISIFPEIEKSGGRIEQKITDLAQKKITVSRMEVKVLDVYNAEKLVQMRQEIVEQEKQIKQELTDISAKINIEFFLNEKLRIE